MIGALIYVQWQSIKNRLWMRLRRLKKPKYLAGAVVGGAYFYFFFFRNLFAGRRRGTVAPEVLSPESALLFELLGALALGAMVLAAWLFPHQRAALAFTEAEIAFLFPAPVTRKTLIHFKLLRSQAAILFTTLLLTFITRRFGGGGTAWVRAAGWWVILSTLNLHTLGASFARTRLLDHGMSNLRRRILVLSALALLLAATVLWVKRTIPPPETADLAGLDAIKYYVRRTLTSGPAVLVLYPFRLVVRPYLATDGSSFLLAFGPAFALLLLHYLWVARSDVAFEEASLALARKRAEMVAAVRAGSWHSAAKMKRRKRPPFGLRPTGTAAVAFLWKNLISAGQGFSLRTWLFLGFFAVCIGGAVSVSQQGHGWLLSTVGIMSVILGGYSLFLGPAFLRQDLRQDLVNADILKTYPLRGWQVVLGELLTPATILTGVQWCLVLLSVTMFSRVPGGDAIPLANRLSLGAGAAIIAPMLNLISLVIPNASVLLFPAWMQIGREHVGGVEVIGQRLIFMVGSVLVFAFALMPAAILFGLVFFLAKLLVGMFVAVPLAAVAAAIVLAAEAALAIWWMGRLFERFDLSTEPTS
ncbi:MAG TPA: putative ABC exporter domain-containing protein [Haliangiales bacterium]|nr:putative ABC exporter domain-containing protein [Haliangiales bacterium]